MKTSFRIFIILLVSLLVSGALYLVVGNTSSFPNTGGAAENIPVFSGRPEGGDHQNSASLSRGLSQVGISLAKLTGITLLVLLVQTLIARLTHRIKERPLVG